MKHLITALLRWRQEYMETRGERKHRLSGLDEAVEPRLELVPSSTRNDLVLRVSQPVQIAPEAALPVVQKQQKMQWSDVDVEEKDDLWEVQSQSTSSSTLPATPSSR